MKLRKPHRYKNQKQFDNQQTLQNFMKNKLYEERLEKDQFFNDLYNHIQTSFDHKSLQLFEEHLHSAYLQSKNKKHKNHHIKSKNNSENFSQVQQQKLQNNMENNLRVFRKLDQNIFQSNTPQLFPASMTYRVQNKQRYISTPKIKKPNNLLVRNKIYKMELTMKRNYQRIKQRILGQNTNYTQQKPYIFIRNSLEQRAKKSQRICRFKTQSIENDIQQANHIPNILLNDIKSTRNVPIHRRINLQDRRMQCFKGQNKFK